LLVDPPDSEVEGDDASLVVSGELVLSAVVACTGSEVAAVTVGVAPVVRSMSTGV
jgi:hypothetical protein